MDTTTQAVLLDDNYGYQYVDYEDEDDYLLSQKLWIYGSPVILVLGTIGNVLSLLVMMRKSLRSHTTSLYLVVLAVVDTLALYTGLLRYWIRALSGIDLRDLSNAGCKLHMFLVYFLLQFEAWILVCVAVERFAAIFIPLRAKMIFTKKFAATQISITGLILIFINGHLLKWEKESGICTLTNERLRDFFFSTWGWIDFCLASFIPFILMISSNAAIISKLLFLQHSRMKNLNVKPDAKMRTMTAILLTINFAFFLTTAPINVFLGTQDRWYGEAETAADLARLELVWTSLNIMAYTNNAMNFLLYCLSGLKFRAELLTMFHCGRNRVRPSSDCDTTE